MTSRRKLKVLDIFSGIGGFSLGLERTGGFETVAFCEIDPFCRRVLAKHWPNVPVFEDVKDLSADAVGHVDIICGGFPCQDISLAGEGKGLDGERSGLWREIARLVGEIRPRYVFVENVAALLSRGMGTVLGDLATLGYDAEWHCIPAAALGAQHIRDRIWIVAYPDKVRELQPQGGQQDQRRRAGHGPVPAVSDPDPSRYTGGVQAGTNATDDGGKQPRLRLAVGTAPRIPRDYWDYQPVLGRGVHGVPNRVDRIAALGNAVVPQIPEMIGNAILALEQN